MIYNTYIQQIEPNGASYNYGTMKNLISDFNIACQEFPFKVFPSTKELASNNWFDEDGDDVYIPSEMKFEKYDIEVTFLCKGSEASVRQNLQDFASFITGRTKGDVSDTVQSPRLAIYDEYVGIGRKDVVVKQIDNKVFYYNESSVDAIAQFVVKLTVFDPVTTVTPVTSVVQGRSVVTSLLVG